MLLMRKQFTEVGGPDQDYNGHVTSNGKADTYLSGTIVAFAWQKSVSSELSEHNT